MPRAAPPGQRGRCLTIALVASKLHGTRFVDLTAVEGIDERTALVVFSEVGTDMSRWPSEKHFGS